MKIWFLDYAESDYTSAHPLGVLEGIVDINEQKFHAKCDRNNPYAKIFVPFNYVKNGTKLWDTRWPRDVYPTRRDAEAAYRLLI